MRSSQSIWLTAYVSACWIQNSINTFSECQTDRIRALTSLCMCFTFGAPLEFSELSSKALCLQETSENGLRQKRFKTNQKKIGKCTKKGAQRILCVVNTLLNQDLVETEARLARTCGTAGFSKWSIPMAPVHSH